MLRTNGHVVTASSVDRVADAESYDALLAEEVELYPALAAEFRDAEATVTMSRGHAEIGRLTRRLGRHLAEQGSPATGSADDLRATLYGLDAVLRLHFAQEEEAYFALSDSQP